MSEHKDTQFLVGTRCFIEDERGRYSHAEITRATKTSVTAKADSKEYVFNIRFEYGKRGNSNAIEFHTAWWQRGVSCRHSVALHFATDSLPESRFIEQIRAAEQREAKQRSLKDIETRSLALHCACRSDRVTLSQLEAVNEKLQTIIAEIEAAP